MIDKLQVAPHVTEIIEKLQNEGFETYVVGGAIRDLLLGRIPKDYDLSTAATPEEIKQVFGRRRARIIGRRFKLVHLYHGREIIEISTFRKTPEKKQPVPGKFAEVPENMILHDNEYGSSEEDAFRRDFTVNAIFYDPVARNIVDYTGYGVDDVIHGRVRAIGDPALRFEEDPVRMLRALKLVGQYNFALTAETETALIESTELITHASKSRLTLELEKILKGAFGDNIFAAFKKYSFLKYFMPYWADHWDTPASNYAMKLLAERNKRLQAGLYRDSISLAVACITLPFVEQVNQSEPGQLWEFDVESTQPLIRNVMLQVFEPHSLIKRLVFSAQRMLVLQTALLNSERRKKIMHQKGYPHARELMLMQNQVAGNFEKVVDKWPPNFSSENKSPKRRRKRFKNKKVFTD